MTGKYFDELAVGMKFKHGGRTVTEFGIRGAPFGDDYHKYAADGQEGFKSYLQDLAGSTRQALDAVALPQWAKDTFSTG